MECENYNVFFSHLANKFKNDIIVALREKEMNVTELSNELNAEQSKLSHALVALRLCKVVNVRQDKKERFYSLNDQTIIPMLKLIDNHATVHCSVTGCTCLKRK